MGPRRSFHRILPHLTAHPLISASIFYLLSLLLRIALIIWGWLNGEISVDKFIHVRLSGAFWDPLPRLFILATLKASFNHPVLCMVYYALLSSTAAPLTYFLARSLNLSPAISTISALLTACYPYYVSVALFQPHVGVTIALTVIASLMFTTVMNKPTWYTLLLCNVFGVVLIADRSHAFIFVIFLTLFASIAIFTRNRPARGFSLVLIATFILTSLSYSAIRFARYGFFSPFTQKSGYNLLQGHNPYVGDYLRTTYTSHMEVIIWHAAKDLPAMVRMDIQNPKYEHILAQKAITYIRENPLETLVNTVLKAKRYWDFRLEDSENDPLWKKLAYTLPYLTSLILAILGSALLLARKDFHTLSFLWGGILIYAAPMIATVPLIRVRMFSEFLLLILSSIGVRSLIGFFSSFTMSSIKSRFHNFA